MHVIRHRTPGKHPHLRLTQLIHHQMQIRLSIYIGKEHIAAIHSSLSHMMGHAGHDASRISSHTVYVPISPESPQKTSLEFRKSSDRVKPVHNDFPPEVQSKPQ